MLREEKLPISHLLIDESMASPFLSINQKILFASVKATIDHTDGVPYFFIAQRCTRNDVQSGAIRHVLFCQVS